MKNIVLKRPQEKFNKNCAYQIYLNDKILTTLKNGEEKVVKINDSSDSGFLKAKIHWCGSPKIALNTIEEYDSIEFVGNKIFNRYLLILSPLILIIGLLIGKNSEVKNFGPGLMVIVLILLIGSITVWKNNWINLGR